jgi:hypothetical protein
LQAPDVPADKSGEYESFDQAENSNGFIGQHTVSGRREIIITRAVTSDVMAGGMVVRKMSGAS